MTKAIHLGHTYAICDISQFPPECIAACSALCRCDDAVAHWQRTLPFTVDRAAAIKCLRGYGAWGEPELRTFDDVKLAQIVLWSICCNFREWDGTPESPCGSDIFCLE